MAKRMSRTLAAEIAERTLVVVNPANRGIALNAALGRHGFSAGTPGIEIVSDRAALIAWLLATYAPHE